MFRFLTSPGHGYTVEAFVRPLPGADLPRCEATTYDAVLRSTHTVKAVHVFTDLERLSGTELVAAADLYRSLREVGIPCLNDPARVMCRYQLLCHLFEEGINPFAAYRADGRPKPARFPVFVRNESDHYGPMSGLIKDQDELDNYLKGLIDRGRPLPGLLVIEYAAELLTGGVWRKTGTHRIGKNYSVNGHIVSDNWVAKDYVHKVMSDALLLEEQAAIIANDVPEAVCRAFNIAGIEWGRADHAMFRGREIIYEINTAPYPRFTDPNGNKIRTDAKRIDLARMCALLREIDYGDGTGIRYRGKPFLRRFAGRIGREIKRMPRFSLKKALLLIGYPFGPI